LDSNGQVTVHSILPRSGGQQAQLAYNAVGAWLEGSAPGPQKYGLTGTSGPAQATDEVAQTQE